jgi:hypothetical protein
LECDQNGICSGPPVAASVLPTPSAGSAAANGLCEAISLSAVPTGLAPLKESWLSFKRFLADLWVVAVHGILKAGNNLWSGLLIGFKQCGNGIMGTWDFFGSPFAQGSE